MTTSDNDGRGSRSGRCPRAARSWRHRLAALGVVVLGCASLAGPARADSVTIQFQGITLGGNLVQPPEADNGDIILMVHGTLAHAGMEIMTSFQASLAELGLTTLAVTLSLGEDKRSGMFPCDVVHNHRHSDALGEIAAWWDWLRAQGFGNIALLGHSRGGAQVTQFALEQESRSPSALLLVAPMTFDRSRIRETYESRTGDSLQALIVTARSRLKTSCDREPMKIPGFLHCGSTVVSPASFLSYYDPETAPDTPELLTGIGIPVLVVTGTEDNAVPDLARRIADQAGIAIAEIDGADHFFRDLYADESAEAIADFLERLGHGG